MDDFEDTILSKDEIKKLEVFLRNGLGHHRPKQDFKNNLKKRLSQSKVFDKRKYITASWVIGLGVALTGATIYSFGYFINKLIKRTSYS